MLREQYSHQKWQYDDQGSNPQRPERGTRTRCYSILLPTRYAPRGEDDGNHVRDKSQDKTCNQDNYCCLLLREKARGSEQLAGERGKSQGNGDDKHEEPQRYQAEQSAA